MQEITIKCSKCGKILRLLDKPGIENSVFACPVCNVKQRVGACQRVVLKQSIASEETQYGFEQNAPMTDSDETQIIGMSKPAALACLVDSYGRNYQLVMGTNTIGRKSPKSTASLQITTDDQYMSRNHAVIEVKSINGQMMYSLRNGANKNPSYLNGSQVEDGDQFILNDGDKIKMGLTEIIFKK